MAFPTLAATNNSVNSSVTTSHTVSLPASISAGDLLIFIFGLVDAGAITTPSGWTLIRNVIERPGVSETIEFSTFYKVASGSEGASVTVTTAQSRRSAHVSYRITGYSSVPEGSTGTSGGSGSPDPDSLTPSGGTKEYMWIACGGNRGGGISAAPTNYINFVATATTGIGVALCTRNLSASSEDPGTFTTASGEWCAMTIAVFPVAASGPANLKTYNTNAKANIKTIDTNPIANVKTLDTNA